MVVFISSTVADLHEHRRVLYEKLDQDGHSVERMEDFGSTGLTPIASCFKAIERSDVSIMCVGYRYGSLVPAHGVSYTEAEYEHAQALGLPVYAYFREDFDENVARSSEGEAAKQRLKTLRTTIESETTVDRAYFTTPDDLADRALSSLAKWGSESSRPVFQRSPLLDVEDTVAYATKVTLRNNQQLLDPPVVLVDLSAATLMRTPPPRASRLTAKLWMIKRDLEEDGLKVLMFTSLPITDRGSADYLGQRIDQLLASDAIVVLFAKGDDDIALLERFRGAGEERFVFWRDRPPPSDFDRKVAEQWTSEGLQMCALALQATDAVGFEVREAVLRALGTAV